MEHEGKEGAGGARGQNTLFIMSHDWASVTHFLAPLVERIDPGVDKLQGLVIASDPETAVEVAVAAVRLGEDRGLRVLAATSPARTARLLKLEPPQLLAGDPETLIELVRSSTLRLSDIRAVAMAWADEIVALGKSDAFEALFVDMPKEASRLIVAARGTPEVDALVERYARRAKRVVASSDESLAQLPVEYVTTVAHGRVNALTRLLDDLDPESSAVYVRSAESEAQVRTLLVSLGYDRPDSPVTVSRGGASRPLSILYDLPASREELAEAVGPQPARIVAIIQPRQMESLKVLAGDGAVKPIQLSGPAAKARTREAGIRTEIVGTLEREQVGREVLVLEPLLSEYDGVEVAAALLRMLEAERSKPVPVAAARGFGAERSADMKRLFMGVGSRDGVRPGEIVGALTGEAGITSAEIGRVEIRESHSLVEIAAHLVPSIIPKIDGTTIRGRRVPVREDLNREDRPERSVRGGPRGGRPDDRDRSDRGAPRDRAGPRSGAARPGRPAGPPRGDRPDRGARDARRDRGDRPAARRRD